MGSVGWYFIQSRRCPLLFATVTDLLTPDIHHFRCVHLVLYTSFHSIFFGYVSGVSGCGEAPVSSASRRVPPMAQGANLSAIFKCNACDHVCLYHILKLDKDLLLLNHARRSPPIDENLSNTSLPTTLCHSFALKLLVRVSHGRCLSKTFKLSQHGSKSLSGQIIAASNSSQ
mgnify:CR=1 FL=1